MTDSPDRRSGPGSIVYWLASTLAVVLIPDLLRFRDPFWLQDHAAQAPLLGLGFVGALWAASRVGRHVFVRITTGLVVLGLVAVAVQAVVTYAPATPLARSSALVAIGLGAMLFLAGEVVTSGLVLRAAATVLVVGMAALLYRSFFIPDTSLPPPRIVFSIYQPLELITHGQQVAQADAHRGGGFARAGDRMLVITGSGALYELMWDGSAAPMHSSRLPIPSPVDMSAFDPSLDDPILPETVRVNDVITRQVEEGWQFFVSHHRWNEDGRCVTMAVSTATMTQTLDGVVTPWSILTESKPCLPFGDSDIGGNFAGLLSGGRLAWRGPDELLWTLGDHGLDVMGRPEAGAQIDEYDYGKTRRLDVRTGTLTPFTKGQRNPQGLYIAPDGKVWSTEHGPRGGDELNLLIEGRNYGWPYATFGTDYGQLVWPPAENPPPGSDFTNPQLAFLPSVATSAVIGIESTRFSRWTGDLMIASLAGRALHRVKVEGDRVLYTERIPIGEEIRDVIEGPTGDLWMWNDRGLVLTLRPAPPEARGAIVVEACTGCHVLDPGEPPVGRGPNLAGIVGAAVAANPDYPTYSPALRALGGRWTPERLEAFLADPSAFAPGTTMNYKVAIQEDRDALIAFLTGR